MTDRPAARTPLTSFEKIDVCRGLFAFLVVVAHALDIAWAIHPAAPAAMSPAVHDFWLYVVAAGVFWVIGFFVVSGYCIQLSVERQVERGRFPLKTYLIARLSRILPLYYVALAAAVVFEWLMASSRPSTWPHGLDPEALFAQLFVVQNFQQTFGSFAPSWSITNEMFYYVFFGAVVCVAMKRGVRPASLGMALCLALAVLLEAAYFGWFRTDPIVRSLGLLFGLGTIWFQGAFVAVYRPWLRRSAAARRVSAAWPLVLLLAVGLWYSHAVHIQVLYLVLGAAFTMMLARFVALDRSDAPAPDRGRVGAAIRALGLASYPTYLFHGPFIMWLGSLMTRTGWMSGDWRVTWIFLSVAGIGSGLILGFVAERPLMAWRAGMLKRLKAAERPATTTAPILGMPR
ncbi:acyltransferase family protein [Paludisphaera mucosa]|uniref:Acyltransferase n=1 Tax=Paludisphaera mucosa TaxID=3030827 RepID=A0ABT6FJ42_9BACT|nr:acyltransferase [Paludisphaera mucosa]MDG3007596.1 acyltransferase [Paludisphaera mucosa]